MECTNQLVPSETAVSLSPNFHDAFNARNLRFVLLVADFLPSAHSTWAVSVFAVGAENQTSTPEEALQLEINVYLRPTLGVGKTYLEYRLAVLALIKIVASGMCVISVITLIALVELPSCHASDAPPNSTHLEASLSGFAAGVRPLSEELEPDIKIYNLSPWLPFECSALFWEPVLRV